MRLKLVPILIPALILGACGGTMNRSVESVHQPVVSRTDYVFDMSAGPDGLAVGERERLNGWLSALRTGYGDRLSLDDGGTGNYRVREELAGEAARFGLALADTTAVSTGEVTPGTVRVVLSRSTATVPGCPDHSRAEQPNFDAHTGSDFGCAINRNLASMVANPEDLVRGQTAGGAPDINTATKPVNALRTRETKVQAELEQTRTSTVGAQ
jgi:pilus assembly protein CpaD